MREKLTAEQMGAIDALDVYLKTVPGIEKYFMSWNLHEDGTITDQDGNVVYEYKRLSSNGTRQEASNL